MPDYFPLHQHQQLDQIRREGRKCGGAVTIAIAGAKALMEFKIGTPIALSPQRRLCFLDAYSVA